MCPLHVNQSIEKSQKFHLPFDFEIFLLRTIEELFFSIWVFFNEQSRITGPQGKREGGGIYLTLNI